METVSAIASDPRVARSKESVLQATRELLAERGVGDTTIEAISERSGVAKTTIYRHWEGKGAVVFDVIQEMQGQPPLPDTGTFKGDLTALAVALARGLSESGWSSLLPSLIDAAQRDEDLSKLHKEFAADRHRSLQRIVSRARDRGEIRDGVSDDDVLELIAGPLFYRRLMTEKTITSARARRIVDFIHRAIGLDNDV